MLTRSYNEFMSRNPTPASSTDAAKASSAGASATPVILRAIYWAVGLAIAGALAIAMILGLALAVAFPNLPDISDLSDYRPILPLRPPRHNNRHNILHHQPLPPRWRV